MLPKRFFDQALALIETRQIETVLALLAGHGETFDLIYTQGLTDYLDRRARWRCVPEAGTIPLAPWCAAKWNMTDRIADKSVS